MNCEITFFVKQNTIYANSITLDITSINLCVGEKTMICAYVLPDNVTNNNIIWTSSNKDIVEVNSLGEIIAQKECMAIITATVTDRSGVTASCRVTVVPTTEEPDTPNFTIYEIN